MIALFIHWVYPSSKMFYCDLIKKTFQHLLNAITSQIILFFPPKLSSYELCWPDFYYIYEFIVT